MAQDWRTALGVSFGGDFGAGPAFPRTAGHATYIHRAVSAAKARRDAPFVGHKPSRYAPRPGDILTYARGDLPVDYDELPSWFQSHGDIVVEVDEGAVTVIGGNVSDAVTRRPFKLNRRGLLADRRVHWIAVIENRLDDPVAVPPLRPAGAPHLVAANPSLRLRALPDPAADIVGAMPNGTLVYAGPASGDWAPIDMFGDGHVDGYAHTGFLRAA